jgi:manganese transport protein
VGNLEARAEVHTLSFNRLREFLEFFGPAWIVMIADVDAPSVLTAAEVGAKYSYGLVWFFLLLIIPLFLIQEASGRIGVATRKGLGDVIRESYSRKIALLTSLPMATVDVVSYIAEFTGIAIGAQLLGVPALVALPLAYLLHIAIVVKKKFLTIEKAMLALSTVLIVSYGGSLLVRGISFTTSPFYFGTDPSLLFLLAASAGAVIMPFMLFYQASATAEKRTTRLWAVRVETLVGAVASEIGMVVILMASSSLGSSLNLEQPATLALGLSSLAGAYAPYLFGFGLILAAFLALVVISLASSWAVVEAIGWGRSRFFWIYVLESVPAVAIPILQPNHVELVLNLMVAFVFVLVGPGILVGVLSSNKKIMGQFASSWPWKVGYWLSLIGTVALGIIAVVSFL